MGSSVRLLIGDVDGTVVTHDKVLTARASAGVNRLGAAGIAFTITRGGCRWAGKMPIEALALTEPMATSTGAERHVRRLRKVRRTRNTGREVLLLSRNANDRSQWSSDIARAVAALPARTLLLDGEVVVFDRHNVSRFQLLQELGSEPEYSVFDCLYGDGQDLRSEPLARCREALVEAVGRGTHKGPVVFLYARVSENGLQAYQIVKARSFEGVVAKEAGAPYVEGRSKWRLKFKVRQEDEFIVIGYTAPSGSRQYFGAILLGAYYDDRLIYVGKVGTGFMETELARIHRKAQPLVRNKPPIADPPRQKDISYLAPRLIAQIAYEEVTKDHKLRQPVFLGPRDDKRPEDITFPEPQ